MSNHKNIVGDGKIDTIEEVVHEVKSIFVSRTFWVNAVALVAFAIQSKWGFVIDEATQVAVLSTINIWLRSVTTEPVRWRAAPRKPKKVVQVENEGV